MGQVILSTYLRSRAIFMREQQLLQHKCLEETLDISYCSFVN